VYRLHIVSSDAFPPEKLDHMRILGASLQIVPSENGGMTEKLTRDMVEAARVIATQNGAFWTDQLNNRDQLSAYYKMADEIWTQTGGQIDGFVQSVGTAASVRGIGESLRRRDERVKIVAVEPSESPVLSGGNAGAHRIDGVGAGFVVPLWQPVIADQIEQVSTDEANAMAFRLAREEGLFAGTSTGANVIAALRLAAQLGPHATVVTVMCDTGMKYLNTYGVMAR
jgi:cysteine synthase A